MSSKNWPGSGIPGFDPSGTIFQSDTISGVLREVSSKFLEGIVQERRVSTFSGLPPPSEHLEEIWYVLNPSGSYLLLNKKKRGVYSSDGLNWVYGGDNERLANTVYFNSAGLNIVSSDNVQNAIEDLDGALVSDRQEDFLTLSGSSSTSNPQIVTPNINTFIPGVITGVNTDYKKPTGDWEFNTSTKMLEPANLGDTFLLEVKFLSKQQVSSSQVKFVTISNNTNKITKLIPTVRPAGVWSEHSEIFHIFTDNDILNHGVTLVLNTNNKIFVTNCQLTIQKL